MTKQDLEKFLIKIEQLNLLVEYIEKYPDKKSKLSNCKNHEEVIKLTRLWGFERGKRWGEV